jgi:hypothetical protein
MNNRAGAGFPSTDYDSRTAPFVNGPRDPVAGGRPMSSRPDPKRIYEAQRAGTLRRLIAEGEFPDQAERLVAQWELQAAQNGRERDGRYWDAGWAWMFARRRGRPAVAVGLAPDVADARSGGRRQSSAGSDRIRGMDGRALALRRCFGSFSACPAPGRLGTCRGFGPARPGRPVFSSFG